MCIYCVATRYHALHRVKMRQSRFLRIFGQILNAFDTFQVQNCFYRDAMHSKWMQSNIAKPNQVDSPVYRTCPVRCGQKIPVCNCAYVIYENKHSPNVICSPHKQTTILGFDRIRLNRFASSTLLSITIYIYVTVLLVCVKSRTLLCSC